MWIEVFRTGRHTDSRGLVREWTEADLDRAVESYDPGEHEAPVVIGHPRDNSPAYGWVSALKREGDRLLARLKQLAPGFRSWVRRGLYKKRSVSFYADGTLRHVGFLGAMPPAVKGLADVNFADAADALEYSEPTEPLTGPLALELEREREKRRQAEARLELWKKQDQTPGLDFAERVRRMETERFIDRLVVEGKVLPCWKSRGLVEFMLALDRESGEFEFTEGESATPAAWFRAWLDGFSGHGLFKNMTRPRDDTPGAGLFNNLTEHV